MSLLRLGRLSCSGTALTFRTRSCSLFSGAQRNFNPFRNFAQLSVPSMDSQVTELVDFYTNRDPVEWFRATEEFDKALKTKYSSMVSQARNNELDALEDTPEGSLALIILLDQIPRNIFRGSGESYSSDHKAHGVAARAIARKFDQEIGQTKRETQLIFYLPFMHAEDLVSQIACRALLQNLGLQYPEGSEQRKNIVDGMAAADSHLECIMKLGRFPARNEPLGRNHTQEEIQWLKDHPRGF